MLKYLITGTARGGTGFMSELLSYNGISCSHEKVMRISSHNPVTYLENARVASHQAESSWAAAPFAAHIQSHMPHLKVIQVVRDPIKTIKSFMDMEFFTSRDRVAEYVGPRKLMTRYIGSGQQDIEACIDYLVAWYEFLAEIPEKVVVNVDDMDYNVLSELMGRRITPLKKVVNDKSTWKRLDYNPDVLLERVELSPKYLRLKELAEANQLTL